MFDHEAESWEDRSAPAQWAESGARSQGWLMAGVAALAIGGLAWYYFGGDIKRYIKMERM
jgi:hypothetical protein